MGRHVCSTTGSVYRGLVKPLLFKSPPDDVHQKMLSVGTRVQEVALAKTLMRQAWAYSNPDILRQVVHGIAFDNPVGLSAGFDKNFRLAPLMQAVGFGFMEGGSLTLDPCEGNPKPWFHRLPRTKSIIVHVGLANEGVDAILRRLAAYPADLLQSFPLNISVAKTNTAKTCNESDAIEDYVGSLQAIKAAGAGRMVTINISCPNTYGGEPFTTPDRLERLLKKVDAVGLDVPVFIKMPIDLSWKDFRALLDVAAKHAVAGVTIGNLAKDRGKIKFRDPLPADFAGGMSGKPTQRLSNDLIRRTYQKYGQRFTIIGVGGIFSAEDAYTKIKLGATLVELITGMIFQGPQLIGQINRGLAELLLEDGYVNVSQAIGADVKKNLECPAKTFGSP